MIENFLSSFPYAATTKRTYADILTRFLGEAADPQIITAGELIYWLEKTSGWGNARQCLAMACIKKYFAFAYGRSHPALNAKIKRVKGKLQRAITQQQADILLASFDRHTAKGARDLALASMFLQTGFRCAEMCSLQQADVDTERGLAQVIVKGGSWEVGMFKPDTAAHLEHWKRFREQLNPQGGFMFVSLKSNYVGRGITPEGLNRIVSQWGSVLNMPLSPHDFRRSFATITGENGAPDTGIMYAGRWHDQDSFNKYTRTYRMESVRKFLPNTAVEPIVPK